MINNILNRGMFRQKGVALAFSMVILVVLTMLAVTALKTSGVDEKMSGNVRSQELAFQAADAAIAEAEARVLAISSAELTGNNGLLDEDDAEPDLLDSTTWATASMVTEGTQIAGTQLAGAPRYIIKYVQDEDFFNPALKKGLNELNGGPDFKDWRSVFRVTVQGIGATPNTSVVLQGYVVAPQI